MSIKNTAVTGTPKFQVILASTGQDVLDKRSQLVFKSALAAMNRKLTSLNEKKDAIEYEILNLTDLSVETRDSLRPGDKNFNATAWIDKMCDLSMQLALLEDEIEIAEGIQAEYFTDAPATEQAAG